MIQDHNKFNTNIVIMINKGSFLCGYNSLGVSMWTRFDFSTGFNENLELFNHYNVFTFLFVRSCELENCECSCSFINFMK